MENKIIATNETIHEIVKQEIHRLGKYANLNHIDVSQVTNMRRLFAGLEFDGEIDQWNVSNVITMEEMFLSSSFEGFISHWDVSNVTNMSSMFRGSHLRGFISKWNTSNVKDMSYMFAHSCFDGDISNWDTSNVENMEFIFYGSRFEGTISNYKLIATDDNIHEVVRDEISRLGYHANLNHIDVSRVTDMSYLFNARYEGEPPEFDGDISQWNVSNVVNMENMFENSPFNGDISRWNVSSVKNMNSMFSRSQFNGDISDWNVSNVIDGYDLFHDCIASNTETFGEIHFLYAYSLHPTAQAIWDRYAPAAEAMGLEGPALGKAIWAAYQASLAPQVATESMDNFDFTT